LTAGGVHDPSVVGGQLQILVLGAYRKTMEFVGDEEMVRVVDGQRPEPVFCPPRSRQTPSLM